MILALFLIWFFDDVFDQRMMWITKSIVQNPPIFTIDFKDFAIATKYENRWKIFEKLCERSRFDDTLKALQKSWKNTSQNQ